MKPSRIVMFLIALSASVASLSAQTGTPSAGTPPPVRDPRIYSIIDSVSAGRIESDVRTLVGFGTRHTLSDTLSSTRGIGAARRWIKAEFDRISASCGGCLEVSYQRTLFKAADNRRLPRDTWIVNVVAVLRGTEFPNRYVMMSGDIDSRVSDVMNDTSNAPGANDNASGMAGVLEAARVLTKYRFPKSIVFVGLSGEEQGLFGGKALAALAKKDGWDIEAFLNNDMIGNVQGIDSVTDNTVFRVFGDPIPVTETERERRMRRYIGGVVDGPSLQVARYVARITSTYFTNLNAMMIYRLDRFGRGGQQTPFDDEGYPGVRIMEAHENYNRQHQDVRVENGIHYGDVIAGVDFNYAAKLTAVNAATLASLAWAPPPPTDVAITGAVKPSTTLRWTRVPSAELAGYKVYWRLTTEPQWSHWAWAGDVSQYTLKDIIIDNYFFGVAAVAKDGHESVVQFPRR
ncbi:MAG: M20/M25/M40 family metallo-hydrolase [Gemmatimonadota bacterium]